MPNLKLTYFDSAGRAEPIRIALHIAGLPFEDRRLKFPDFAQAKSTGELPLGQVPVLEVDGLAIVQTASIMRYVARIGATDLIPADPLVALIADSALDSFNDNLSHALMPSLFERDMTKKLEMRAALAAGPLAAVLRYTDQLIARTGGPFLGGSKMSIADIVVGQQILQIRNGGLDGISTETLAPYERVNAMVDAYVAEPRIVAYRDR